MTFIGLQVLGSMSLLSGSQQTSSNVGDKKNAKEKEKNLASHVNLKKLKQEKPNHHTDEGNYYVNNDRIFTI